eukprot:COSAG02_NODE_1071_length_14802_cov_5.546419_5_plen_87_part_00
MPRCCDAVRFLAARAHSAATHDSWKIGMVRIVNMDTAGMSDYGAPLMNSKEHKLDLHSSTCHMWSSLQLQTAQQEQLLYGCDHLVR